MALLQRVIKPAAKRQFFWLAGGVTAAALLALPVFGGIPALAVLYGGVVIVASTGLLLWRMSQPPGDTDAHKQLSQFYRTSLERLVLVCVMLSAGLGLLDLPPVFLLCGFVIGIVIQATSTVLIWMKVI